jgi:hypothetical protein
MATTTNFGWETPDDTDLVKDGAAAIRTALGGVDTSFVDLKGGTTGQVLAKASATDLDFTWATDASGIPATIFDAKGDIIAASAADTAARLAVGANDTVLMADSTAATGLKWGTPLSGGMTLISSTALSGTSTVLTSIPQTYKHLFLIFANVTGSSNDSMQFRFNGNTSTQYSVLDFGDNGGTFATGGATPIVSSIFTAASVSAISNSMASRPAAKPRSTTCVPSSTPSWTKAAARWSSIWTSPPKSAPATSA